MRTVGLLRSPDSDDDDDESFVTDATDAEADYVVRRTRGGLTVGGEERVPVVVPEISQRFKAPTLLLMSVVAGMIAFTCCVCIEIVAFFSKKGNSLFGLGHRYKSGHGYWPATVSESVHDGESPQGKIFYTFLLLFFLGLFLSWYPYNLRNVYTGKEKVLGCCCYWTTFRQYTPAAGCLILIGVTTYPSAIAAASPGHLYYTCVALHLIGAALMFMGYMWCELKCIAMCGFSHPSYVARRHLNIGPVEKHARACTMCCAVLFYLLFILFMVCTSLPFSDEQLCCNDVWLDKGSVYHHIHANGTIGASHVVPSPRLLDTASGWPLFFKVACYMTECVAGVFLLLNLLCIWYWCEERHVDWADAALEMVYDDERDERTLY